jgi:hypothetical protein
MYQLVILLMDAKVTHLIHHFKMVILFIGIWTILMVTTPSKILSRKKDHQCLLAIVLMDAKLRQMILSLRLEDHSGMIMVLTLIKKLKRVFSAPILRVSHKNTSMVIWEIKSGTHLETISLTLMVVKFGITINLKILYMLKNPNLQFQPATVMKAVNMNQWINI